MGATSNAAATVRVGFVSSIKPEKATARVRFPDLDNLVSYDLQVLQQNTRKNKDFWLPDRDEEVVCLFLGNGLECGFILGSTYNKEDKPPVTCQDKRHSAFDDGSWFEYDRKTHQARAHIEGTMDLFATGNINIKSGGLVYINGVQVRANDPDTPSNAAEDGNG